MRPSSLPILLLIILAACSSEEERALKHAREEPLRPAETFTWTSQPLTFQPPPADWRNDRWNQGGLLGVDFVHAKSVGERIYIAEYVKIGKRSEREGRGEPYRLEDVYQETQFSLEGWPVPADSFTVHVAVLDTMAGMEAYRLDFTMNPPDREHQLVGREYYFLVNNHLFEAAFMGLPTNLPLFERVVDTITFPAAGATP